jgi:flagella basal body P-ring formation protein FlgA
LRVSSGARVEVENSAGSSASIRLSGTAMETAFSGQSIHVRLSLGGRIVKAVVRGPHRVELAAAVTPVWGEP